MHNSKIKLKAWQSIQNAQLNKASHCLGAQAFNAKQGDNNIVQILQMKKFSTGLKILMIR